MTRHVAYRYCLFVTKKEDIAIHCNTAVQFMYSCLSSLICEQQDYSGLDI
ncbi:hypothetical protein ACSS6W_003986 [Trichoderma asperelloides]